MAKNMIWHDRRLIGTPPTNIATNTYNVDQNTELIHSVSWITTFARSQGGLDNLFIMCHGYEAIVEDETSQTSSQNGGFGLQLCRQGLVNTNLSTISNWRGLIKKITLYACAVADAHPSLVNNRGDGWLYCREFAAYTEAEVIASDTVQQYSYQVLAGGIAGRIDFGAWEGDVFSFKPDGSVTRLKPKPAG